MIIINVPRFSSPVGEFRGPQLGGPDPHDGDHHAHPAAELRADLHRAQQLPGVCQPRRVRAASRHERLKLRLVSIFLSLL